MIFVPKYSSVTLRTSAFGGAVCPSVETLKTESNKKATNFEVKGLLIIFISCLLTLAYNLNFITKRHNILSIFSRVLHSNQKRGTMHHKGDAAGLDAASEPSI